MKMLLVKCVNALEIVIIVLGLLAACLALYGLVIQ